MNAEELNALADEYQQDANNARIPDNKQQWQAVANALRLAATLAEFGECLFIGLAPTLRKVTIGWRASLSNQHGNIEDTPEAAMRAAIDAAKPPPKASGVVQSHIDAFLATLSYSQRQSFEQAKLEDAVALRDAATRAVRYGLSLDEAKAEFAKVTKQDPEEPGCSCCGQPHEFYERMEETK